MVINPNIPIPFNVNYVSLYNVEPCLTNALFLGDNPYVSSYKCLDGSDATIAQFVNNILNYATRVEVLDNSTGSWEWVDYGTGVTGLVDIDTILMQMLLSNGTANCIQAIKVYADGGDGEEVILYAKFDSEGLTETPITESEQLNKQWAYNILDDDAILNNDLIL